MFKLLDVLGFAIVFASALAAVAGRVAWPLAVVGVVVGLGLWALGSIGEKVNRLERAAGADHAGRAADSSRERGDTP